MKTIFIFAYYSYKDPVFQSAVLPYFTDFPEKEKFRFVLLTFEQRQHRLSAQAQKKIKEELKHHRIFWQHAYWHSGRFKPLKKAFDFLWGITLSIYLILRNNADIIYSEGFPGAIIGHYLSLLTGKKHIVHTFEPHADYMIESGIWSADSWEARLIKYHELKNCAECLCHFYRHPKVD